MNDNELDHGNEGTKGRPSDIGASIPDYPEEMVSDVVTQLGTPLHVRPIRPYDAPLLLDFHRRLSLRSVYRRYLYVHRVLSDAEVERFTHVDYLDRLALVAEDDHGLVAVARYDRIPDTSDAEVAFVVADEYQNHGIGTMLLEQLAAAAWQRGITAFVATTLAENQEMRDVFANSGFPVTTAWEDDTVGLHFPITPNDVYRAACRTRHERLLAIAGDDETPDGAAPCGGGGALMPTKEERR